MSTTIDERVVEMRFDNQHFEKNVSTSMSTLDKLKQKLNLTGASKGLENIDSAAKKVNMSGLSAAVDTVGARFSAMEVMGVTALANITNSAVNAGKRIVSALTIDPVKTGFQEYETQINSVQTILANTESKGSTIDDVNEALEQLNKYADKTIYNFTEMTRNIGTFTAAGVDLDTSVNAIQGIANLAAVSGSTSQQASTAMYQLSQALASGTVKLMDWNSVVNAGMGGEVFQNALKETARVHGVAIDSMIESEGSFRETLKDGWLTADILTETLQKFTLTTEGLTDEQIKANREMLRAKGYTEDQIDGIFKLGNTATDAATKVKTFTQLWDVMKESAQSGWSQTWKILIGDFEDAKALLTPLSDLMTGFIGKMSDWRNNILSGAMTSPFESIVKKINEVTKATEVVTKATKNYAEVVDSVISGEWGNGQERWDKLTEAGYDWAHVQNLVNEKLGSSVRHATDYKEAQEEVNKTQAVTIERLSEMSNKQLRQLGLTWEEILALRELQKVCEKTGISMKDALANPELLSGRSLLINSFKNLGKVAGDTFRVIARGWKEVFPPKTIEERSEQLYNMIAALHKFTVGIKDIFVNDNKLTETGDKLLRTFKGLFAAIDVIATVTHGTFRFAFEVLRELLRHFDLDILDVTAAIGDSIVEFRDWVDSILNFDKAIDKVVSFLADTIKSIKDWFKGFENTEDIGTYIVEGIISGLQNGARLVWDGIVEVATAIYEGFCDFFQIKSPSRLMMTIGGFLVSGLIIGILSAIPGVGETIAELCSNIFGSFEELDLSKVSAVFWTLSSFFTNLPIFNVISALANMFSVFKDAVGDGIVGIGKGASKVGNAIGNGFSNAWTFIQESSGKFEESLTNIWETIKTIFGKIVDFVKGIDFGSLFAAAIGVGTLIVFKDLADSLEVLAGPLSSIGDFFDGLGDSVERVSKALSKDLKAKAMLNMAKAIGILAVSVFLLASLDPGQLLKAGGVILGLAVIIGGLTLIVGKWGPKETIEIGKFSLVLLGIASSLLIMTIALKQIASLGEPEIKRGYNAVLGLGLIIAGLMLATRLVTPMDITGIGGILLTMSATMLIMVYLMKTISELTPDQIDNGIKTVATFGGLIAGLLFITKLSKKGGVKGLGATLLSMTASLVLMIFVAKLAASMNERELFKGALVISAFGLIIAGLIAATRLAGGNGLKKVGSTILAMSLSIALLGLVTKALGGVDTATLIKGGAAITLLGGMVVGLVAATRLAGGNDLKGVSTTILAMSIAIGILGGIAVLLGWIPLEHLAKGIIAVGILSAMMALMTHSLKGANNIKGTLITMTVAIGLLVVALAALTFIDPQKLAVASASISAVMGMFALLIQSTKNSKNTKQMVRTLLTLVGVVAALGLIIAGLSYITNVDTAIQTSSALAILLTAFSTSLVILGKTGRISTTATKNLAPMLGVTLGLAAILAAMSFIPNPNACIPTAIALGILLNALSASLVVLSMAKGVSATSVGVAALMALVVGELGLMLFMMKELDVNPSIETALALSTLLLAMSAACLILVPVGALASQAVMGAAALAAVILIIGGLVAALGGLSKIDGFNEVIRDGGDTLALIGQAIGKFIGSIIGGIGEGISNSLPTIGENLSSFMDKAGGFISEISGLPDNFGDKVDAFVGAILALTGANVINGLVSEFSNGASIVTLGSELKDFGEDIVEFINGVGELKPESLESIKTLAEALLVLTKAELIDGITSMITGGTSLSTFGAQLSDLGTSLSDFVKNLGTFDEAKLATVDCAVRAIKAMAQAAESLPGEGGWVQKLLGEQSLASFGAQLPILGACLNSFVITLGTFDDAKLATVSCAADAVKTLAQAADQIPNEGGWAAKLLGDNSIATFGAHLPALGTNLAAFVANLGTFTEEQVTTIKCAGNAIKALAQASTNIDGQSEWAKKIFGDNGLSAFGDEMASLGKSLASFVKNLGTFTETQVATVSSAVRAIKALTGLANADLKGAQKNLPEFSEALPELASGIKTFINDMPATESITLTVTNINKILDMVDKFAEANTSAAIEFKNSLRTLGQDGVQAFVNAFTSASAKHDVNQAGVELINEVVKGIESKEDSVKTAGENLAGKAVDGLDDLYDDGESAGKDLGSGLVAGIEAKEDAAYEAGYALGQAAVQGEKDGQASNSPSKLTMLAGRWLGEGLVIGIEKMGKSVYSAGSDLGKSATKSISSAISRITDVIDSDMDIQPTITPVLDLSNVRSGAGTIAGLFDMNPSMGVLANVGAISSTMNRIQNGSSNDDVVSAINKLRKDLGGVRGDTYSINGITYDDGSNIADAVKTLTRAVKVGRRV